MAYAGGSLASGTMLPYKSTLYEVPSGKRALVTYAFFHNTASDPQTIQLFIYYASSGLSVKWYNSAEVIGDKTFLPLDSEEEVPLSAGDRIEGLTSTGSSVTYGIHGATENV